MQVPRNLDSIQPLFAVAPRGLEGVLAEELTALGASGVSAADGGVAFRGDVATCYRINLESRIASRILWQVQTTHYRSEEDVYRATRGVAWRNWFDPRQTMAVKVSAHRCPLKSLDFITLKIKDAVCDRFRADVGIRPSVDTRSPDVRVHAYLDARTVTLYLDTSGDALYKRGYRSSTVEAPIRENLAAGILSLAKWTANDALLDPMCGSGTFLIEAAAMALHVAPGLKRSFAFEKLKNFDAPVWKRERETAQARVLPVHRLSIFGSDYSESALRVAKTNIVAAGLGNAVELRVANALSVSAPMPTGVLVTNPPYGARIGEDEELAAFYPKLGDALKQRFAGWRAYILSADMRLPKLIRLQATKRTPLFNGALECRLFEYIVQQGSMRKDKSDAANGAHTAIATLASRS